MRLIVDLDWHLGYNYAITWAFCNTCKGGNRENFDGRKSDIQKKIFIEIFANKNNNLLFKPLSKAYLDLQNDFIAYHELHENSNNSIPAAIVGKIKDKLSEIRLKVGTWFLIVNFSKLIFPYVNNNIIGFSKRKETDTDFSHVSEDQL